ncbi:hypothetical protein AOLI_G00217820 [Acnodon oligacanthus]
MLQNKSLITGNYASPACEQPAASLRHSTTAFIPLLRPQEARRATRRAAITPNAAAHASATLMLLFHSSEVAHFPAPITDHKIKTGPSGSAEVLQQSGAFVLHGEKVSSLHASSTLKLVQQAGLSSAGQITMQPKCTHTHAVLSP